MPNLVTNFTNRLQVFGEETVRPLGEKLILKVLLLLIVVPVGIPMSVIAYVLDNYCPRFLSWRRTSWKELEDTDKQILDAVPSVKDRKYVPIGDNKLWSIVCNSQAKGTPIVMVHGMGGGVGLWTLNLDSLSRNRPVYAFDLLGFGRSSRPSFSKVAEEAEAQFVDSIEAFRKEMRLNKFILLGHSLGAFLCGAYCSRHPEHVQHLIMVDPWGMMECPPDHVRREVPLIVKLLRPIAASFYPMTILRAIGPFGPAAVKKYRPGLAEMFGEKIGDPSILHKYIYHCNAQNPSGECGFKSMSHNIGWAAVPMAERMTDIEANLPITFIFGAESWVDRKSGWQVKQNRTGYVDVQILKGAGHHVYADRFNLFNSLVESIADSVDKGQTPDLEQKLVQRIHSAPSDAHFADHPGQEPDFQRPVGFPDDNDEAEDGGSQR